MNIYSVNEYYKNGFNSLLMSDYFADYENQLIVISSSIWTYFIIENDINKVIFNNLLDFYIYIQQHKIHHRLESTRTIREVIKRCFFSQRKTKRLLNYFEYEVIKHLLNEKTMKETSRSMGIDVRSVSRHKVATLKKLQARNIQELIIDMKGITYDYTCAKSVGPALVSN